MKQQTMLYVFIACIIIPNLLMAQANQTLSNLTSPTAVSQSLIPGTGTGSPFDLGTSASGQQWKNMYFRDASESILLYYGTTAAAGANRFLHINGGISPGGVNPEGVFLGEFTGNLASSSNNGCVGIGYAALSLMTIGNHNTAVGWRSLYNMSGLSSGQGDKNTMIGSKSGESVKTGSENTGIGWNVFYKGSAGSFITGSYNVGIGGNNVMGLLVAGSYNTVIGHSAGQILTSGNSNIILGYNSGSDAILGISSGANNILIGNGVNTTSSSGTFQLNIGNTIYGEMSADHISIGNTSTPSMFSVGDENQFRVDQNGRIERNNDQETVGNGVASILAAVDLDNQTATLNGTLLAAAPAGTYRISYMGLITTAATTSSSLAIRVRYDDPNITSDVLVPSANVENVNSTSANTIPAGVFSSSVIIKVTDSTDIRYRAIYSSDPLTGIGSMVYSVRITLERL